MARDAGSKDRLPIKIVVPQEHDFIRPPVGGSARKKFCEVDRALRDELQGQVTSIREYFRSHLTANGLPVVARVVLRNEALAKSHRPYRLFSENTCPVIGGESFGRLLISVRCNGLARLEKAIDSGHSKEIVADMSTLSRIEPYTMENSLGSLGLSGLKKYLADEECPGRLKIRVFRHRDKVCDDKIQGAFRNLLTAIGLSEFEQLAYPGTGHLFRLHDVMPAHIKKLASFVGTQALGPFPRFRLLSQYVPHGSATVRHLPPPVPDREYPVVGMIDSGTNPKDSLLSKWLVGRDEEDVPPADQDNDHGSFVAGLVINARGINHGDVRFPSVQAKILDVVAMPKDGTPIYEDDLLQTIVRVVSKHPDIKVWNLSISRVSDVCQDDCFSDFAMALDTIQKKYDVTFVVCAGNYVESPFRGWPPTSLGEADRVHPPADSIRAITVGSLAHADHSSTRVKRGEPSPFSRRGPGAAYLPKPEVCHYGGNCDQDGNCHQVGVLSIDGHGHVAEAIGTSFSTPLVSAILANIRAGVAEPISRNLARALLVQSAALESDPVTARDLPYRGFGVPGDISTILTCAPWQATLIFEPELWPQRKIFHKLDFPIPECFRRPDGRVRGEFLMTLVYDPPCDCLAGAEYCRVNIDASLGTYDLGPDGKPKHEAQIPLQPDDYAKMYEEHLVKHGFKWSPVKVFRRRIKCVEGTRWRLQMKVLYRDEIPTMKGEHAALVLTMFDWEKRRPVYDDVVRAMNVRGWVTNDLRVHERVRTRGQA